MSAEIRVVWRGWVAKYWGGQYADVGHVDANCSAVHCFNYGSGDDKQLVDRKRLLDDLKEWVEEEGDVYYENMIHYL